MTYLPDIIWLLSVIAFLRGMFNVCLLIGIKEIISSHVWVACLDVFHLQASFVLCCVFARSYCRNSAVEVGPSSLVEESVSTVRHIGIQHDGIVTPEFADSK